MLLDIKKLQITKPKFQINFKSQIPISKIKDVWNFEFRNWSLFGFWYLFFGIFPNISRALVILIIVVRTNHLFTHSAIHS